MGRNLAVQASLVELTVTDQHDGLRLDHFLTALLPGRSRSQNQRLNQGGAGTGWPEGRAYEHGRATGEIVTLAIPPPTPAGLLAQALPIEIIYEDADLLVVNKLPAWSCTRLLVMRLAPSSMRCSTGRQI